MAFTPFVETDRPTMNNFNEKFSELNDALAGKAPAYGSTQLIGNIPTTSISTPGWYRICTISGPRGAALIHICHGYSNGGPSDLLVYVNFSQYNPVLTILTSGYYTTYPIDDIRLMQEETSTIFHLDIHYSLSVLNSVGADYWATSAWGSNSADITPQNAALVDDAPTGETELMTAEWSAPPMVLGVEYRTTERYQGKPVYVMAVDGGAFPDNSSKTFEVQIPDASGQVKMLDCYGVLDNGTQIPGLLGESVFDASNYLGLFTQNEYGKFVISVGSGRTVGYNFTLFLKYWKEDT